MKVIDLWRVTLWLALTLVDDEFRLVTEHAGELEATITARIVVLCEQIVDSNLSIYTLQIQVLI